MATAGLTCYNLQQLLTAINKLKSLFSVNNSLNFGYNFLVFALHLELDVEIAGFVSFPQHRLPVGDLDLFGV